MSENEVIKCSKDGSLMVFTYESEKLKDDLVRVSLYYKCPVCGSKRDIEEVRIEKSNEGLIVTRRAYTVLSQEPRSAQ